MFGFIPSIKCRCVQNVHVELKFRQLKHLGDVAYVFIITFSALRENVALETRKCSL